MAQQLDRTISADPRLDLQGAASSVVADELFVLFECDRPGAASTRSRLIGIDEVIIARGSRRSIEREHGRLRVTLPDGLVSSAHARLRRDGTAYIIEDLRSKNGLVVNGSRVDSRILRDGDLIECGQTVLLYRAGRARPIGDPLDVDCDDRSAADVGLFTFHEPLAQQLRSLKEIARAQIPILILGPTGTGKELVARAAHALSRRGGTFVAVNCSALPDGLVDAELFGVRRGAFTGASEDRPGLVRSSHEGTLFLDEVGELTQSAQAKLLRVLQEQEVLSVGATKPVSVDLRLITATHRNLDELVREKRFREDLVARISAFIVQLPTLRERIEDFGIIVAALLVRHVARGEALPTITPEAMRLLLRYPWPQNIRELEHCLRRAIALSPRQIAVEHLPEALRQEGEPPTVPLGPSAARRRPQPPHQETRWLELHRTLHELLLEYRGNISEVARRLGKDRTQVRRWMRMLALSAEEYTK